MTQETRHWLKPAIGCLLALVPALVHAIDLLAPAPAAGFVAGSAPVANGVTQGEASMRYHEQLLDRAGQDSVHAATLANLPGGDVGAWWYGGSREGGKDVNIWFARLDQDTGRFSPAVSVMSRELLAAQTGRHIRKLGNPAAVLDDDGRVWLFFVSVSIGGWAGSAVNVMISDDGAETWSPARRLVTSPFFNISTLVRTSPVLLQDGGLAVPAYHEFIGKFAEILFVGPDGRVRDKKRLTWGRNALQPALVPTSASDAAIVMRYAGEAPMKMLRSSTSDAGRTFERAWRSALPNVDNSVAGNPLPGGEGFWVVYNNSETGRDVLSIAAASDVGGDLVWLHDLEGREGAGRFSYPSVLTDSRGQHHVAWTHDRDHIKHAVFNDSWLLDKARTLFTAR